MPHPTPDLYFRGEEETRIADVVDAIELDVGTNDIEIETMTFNFYSMITTLTGQQTLEGAIRHMYHAANEGDNHVVDVRYYRKETHYQVIIDSAYATDEQKLDAANMVFKIKN